MLGLWWSTIGALAFSYTLAAPSWSNQINIFSPYFRFTHGAEPWRVYRRLIDSRTLTTPEEVPLEEGSFGSQQMFWFKTSSPGASFTYDAIGSTTAVYGYIDTTLSAEALRSPDVLSISVNGRAATMNGTTGDIILDVNTRAGLWLYIQLSGGGQCTITVTLGPLFQGEMAVGFANSRIYVPADDMTVDAMPKTQEGNGNVRLLNTLDRTLWLWEGPWEMETNRAIMGLDGATRDLQVAHGRKGAKVSSRLPLNATLFILEGASNGNAGIKVTLDPPPRSTPTGSNPFMGFGDARHASVGTMLYYATLDPTVRYTVTVEAVSDAGCYLDRASAFPYHLGRANDLTWWPAYYTDPNPSVPFGTAGDAVNNAPGAQAPGNGDTSDQGTGTEGTEKKRSNTSVIAGAIAGSLVGLAVMAGLLTFCFIRRRRRRGNPRNSKRVIGRRHGVLEDTRGVMARATPASNNGFGGSNPNLTSPTVNSHIQPFPLASDSEQHYTHGDPSLRISLDSLTYPTKARSSFPASSNRYSTDSSGTRLPDDRTLMAAVREVMRQQRNSGDSSLDEASIVMAVRQALVETGAGAPSHPETGHRLSRPPIMPFDESSTSATRTEPDSPKSSGTWAPFPTGHDALTGFAAQNRASGGSMGQTVEKEEENALLMAIKELIERSRGQGGGGAMRGTERGQRRIRHDEDGGTLMVAPRRRSIIAEEEVLPPMYDPQWGGRRPRGENREEEVRGEKVRGRAQ